MLVLSIPAVQTKIGKYATDRLNQDFKTNINIDKVGLAFNGDVQIKGVLIKDYKLDTLISASKTIKNTLPKKITSWNLVQLQPYDSSYLAGFVTEKYTIPLKSGHHHAKQVAKQIAKTWSRRDIGGDTQKISSLNMTLSEETFKHILLPVFISSYKFGGKNEQM